MLQLEEPPQLRATRQSDICEKCEEDRRAARSKLVPVPPEHEVLVRAAKALLDNGGTEEDAIIPTLVFAANVSERPNLARIWESLATAESRRDARAKLGDQLYDFFGGLAVASGIVLDGVPVIQHAPFRITGFEGENGSVEEIAVDIFKRSAKPEEVARWYEWYLNLKSLDYDFSRSEVACKTHSEFLRILARPEERSVDPDGGILPVTEGSRKFPPPQIVAAMYDAQRRFSPEPVLTGRQRGPSFKAHNLVPACVAWYVGGRGALIGRSEMKPKVAELLNDRLLIPYGKAPVLDTGYSSHPIWRTTENVTPAILRLERAIRGENSI